MNQELWRKRVFWADELPAWPCPTCESGILRLEGDLERRSARHYRNEQDLSWDSMVERFSGFLYCNQASCAASVAVIGEVNYEYEFDHDDPPSDFPPRYVPKYFFPALPLIKIPGGFPADAREHLESAFALYWNDVHSTANRMRSAVECLIISLDGGRTMKKALHTRIENLGQKGHGNVADLLLAVKWIGNAGSHAEDLQGNDLLDGFEMLEEVFDILYINKRAKLKENVNKINQTKKPLSHSRNRR